MVFHRHTEAGNSWRGMKLFCGKLFAFDVVQHPYRVLHKRYLRCERSERDRRVTLEARNLVVLVTDWAESWFHTETTDLVFPMEENSSGGFEDLAAPIRRVLGTDSQDCEEF